MLRIVLGGVYDTPPPAKRRYRQYSPTRLTNAYQSAIDGEMSVRKASRVYGIPMQTLRDRVLGHVEPETTGSGPQPLLSEFEEARLVQHVTEMGQVGYPYTRAEVINAATEFAAALGKRSVEKPLTYKWFYAFLGRWPELKVQRPKTISDLRARATSRENISRYFAELDLILDKYNLKIKPECIYNVDEKGIQQNFKPTHVVGSAAGTTSVITSEKSSTTTILGCGNAVGQQIPPYFVFAGARMREELMEGSSPGAQGTVSKSGWSNGEVFRKYLETHFVKYANGARPLLLLYDGHRSHISPYIIDWAISQEIILYVLPPHTSHILQPMDVGCFGPFSKIYSNECQKLQRSTGKIVNRYNVCSLACKAYSLALSVKNLQSSFQKSGICPFNPDIVNSSLFQTNELTASMVAENHDQAEVAEASAEAPAALSDSDDAIPYAQSDDDNEILYAVPLEQSTEPVPQVVSTCDSSMTDKGDIDVADTFFKKKRPVFITPYKSERKSISKIVAGKAITETKVANKVKEYLSAIPAKKSGATSAKGFKPPVKSKSAPASGFRTPSMSSVRVSPKPSTSGTSKSGGPIDLNTPPQMEDDDDEYDDSDDEKCCVCYKFQPSELENCHSVVFCGQNVTFVITGPISHTVPQLELSEEGMNLDALTVQTAVK